MIVAVKLFASMRDHLQSDAIELSLGESPTVADVRSAVQQLLPNGTGVFQIAVDHAYAPDTCRLTGREEVACIPPVSGG